jgi:PAS domain S-box-containing protein
MLSARKPAQIRPVGRSLVLVVATFVCIVVSLLLLNDVRSEILSGVRAYVSGEGLYSKAQKDAVIHLVRYAHSHAESDYDAFRTALAVPMGDRQARLELEKPQPDLAVVYQGFIAGRNDPNDVENLATLFRRFRRFSYMTKAIAIWTQGDVLIARLRRLGDGLHASIASGSADPASVARTLEQVDALNAQLTGLEDDFSRTLGAGNRWLEYWLFLVTYAATALLLVVGVFLSWMILRQVRNAERALRGQAERWRVTLASIGDGVLVTDARAAVVSLNPVAEGLTGWTEAEASGRPLDEIFRIVSERTRQPAENPARRVLRAGRIVGLDNHTVLLGRDGSERPIDDSAAPIRDQEGGIVGAVLVFRDVTARRTAEEALRQSEERYRSLAAVTSSVIWTTDAVGAFVAAQPTWEAYTGLAWQTQAGAGWLGALHPDDRERVERLWAQALQERAIFRAEARVVHGAHDYHHCVAHAVPLLNADGSVREWIGALTDVDERKRAEEALQEANDQKDNFLAMLGHELRNPLSPIRAAVHVLRRLNPNEPGIERAHDMIDRQVTHMTRLVDDLLDVSRVARGKISLRDEMVDLTQLVRAAEEDHRPMLEAAGLTLTVESWPAPLWMRGDPTRLSQAIGNLLHNAGKFTNPGGQVSVRLAAADSVTAVLGVRDTGIGIAPQALRRVFETFSQADRSLDRSRGGLGLGLALVKGLVELHGGSVHAVSAGLGHGAEFTLRLPLRPAPDGRPPAPEAAPLAPPSRRVLVVDDNPDVVESMRYLLESSGHRVAVAYSGAAVLETVWRFRPDVVLCDIGLPGEIDGFAVARTMRSDPVFHGLCLIALTGYGQEEDRRRVRAAGFDVHLVKPVDPVQLEQVLATLAGRAGLE